MAANPATESERRTRRARIDPRLRACGWQIVSFDHRKSLSAYGHHAIEEYPTANGPADYALVVDGQLLGIVEAKKVTLGPQNGLTQAERYSRGIDGKPSRVRGYGAPFLYSTNGEVFRFHHVHHELNRSRKIARFHTPGALREMRSHDLDTACEWFAEHPNQHPRLRPYQIEANAAICVPRAAT